MPKITEALSWSWNKYKENFLFFIVVILIFFGLSILSGILQGGLESQLGQAAGLIGFLFSLLRILMEIGYLNILLKFHDGKKPEYGDLFSYYPLFIKFFLNSIVVGFLIVVGFILLILPGIFLLVRLQFAAIMVADKGAGPIEATKKSWNLTRGHFWKLLGFDIVFVLLNILGALLLGIGLAVTIPVTTLSYAYIYRKLSK